MDHVDVILAEWRSERPDLDPSPMAVFGRITRIAGRARPLLAQLLKQFYLTPASFDVLANLRRGGAPYRKTPSALAETSMLSSGGITFRLDRLESDGLVRRVRSREDRRVAYAELTDEGLALVERVIETHLAQERELLALLSQREREQLAKLLAKLERSIVTFDGSEEPARARTRTRPARRS